MGLFQFCLAAGVPLSDLTLTTPLPPWLTGLVSTSLRLPARPLLLFMQFKGGQQHAAETAERQWTHVQRDQVNSHCGLKHFHGR